MEVVGAGWSICTCWELSGHKYLSVVYLIHCMSVCASDISVVSQYSMCVILV
jgi:hypothetical protein